jgi:hypothetical protein
LLDTVRGLHAAGAIDFKKLQEFETFRAVQAPAPTPRGRKAARRVA